MKIQTRYLKVFSNLEVRMRLLCEKVLVLGLALTMGCHDTTAPTTPNSRLYILESIKGQPLPAITSAGAGDTITMLWSTITLDPVGNAVEVAHQRHAYLTFPAEEATYAQRYEYKITGDSITVGSFQRCVDLCPSNRVGCSRIQRSRLRLATILIHQIQLSTYTA